MALKGEASIAECYWQWKQRKYADRQLFYSLVLLWDALLVPVIEYKNYTPKAELWGAPVLVPQTFQTMNVCRCFSL